MRTAKVKDNGPVNIGFVELNHDRQDEQKGIRNGVTGERQGLSGEVELRINEDVDVVYDDQVEAVQVQEHAQSVQQKQQLSHVPVICWERFLPLRSLKVLLVEDDDSTRQLVCALLRNCGYEVTTVANGVQAWKVLTDLTTRINLVLTEVVMPGLSGIGLLSKIMSHKTCKNIPVIMTSSHDSMHVVFKCLSKGAVDYLLKPIRKNELKNLWQHVWRKCHSSSGSGSQSGIQTQKSSKSRSVEDSGNVSGSNDENDIRSISFNVQDGSDNGSGTQSSRTKRAVEVDCPKLPPDQLVDLPDSTCAGVIHSRPEASDNNWVPLTATKEYKGQDDELELEMGLSKIPNVQLEESSKEPVTDIAGGNKDKASDMNTKKDAAKVEKRQLGLNNEKPSGDTSNQAADLMGVMSTGAASQTERIILDIPKGLPKVSETKDKNIYDVEDLPSLELSLKRLGDVGDARTSNHERDILRHSKLSAFRRYDSASTSDQAPTGNVGSCSPPNNSSEVAKTESVQNLQSNSNSTFPYQCSHSSSNNNDRGSTTNSAFTKPAMIHNKPAPKSTAKCLHPASTFQPMQNGHLSPAQSITQGNNDAAVAKTMMSQAGGMDHQIQLSHHCYYYHHYYVHNMPQYQHQQLANGDASLRSMAAEAPHYGSFNMLAAPTEGYGQSGSSNASNARGKNLESDDVTGGEGEADGGIGFRSSDLNPLAKREAALNKFRQKRKERCFEKKVRYQSRKKLAEQRPRVRGQFVRRTVQENRMKPNHSETDPAVSGISKKRFAAAVYMERSVHNSMTHKTWAFSDQVVEPLQSETLFSTSVDSIKTP